jgi:hypothetical protein
LGRILIDNLKEGVDHPERAFMDVEKIDFQIAGQQIPNCLRVEPLFFPDRFEANVLHVHRLAELIELLVEQFAQTLGGNGPASVLPGPIVMDRDSRSSST